MFKSQSAASDTSSQSEQDTSECTTAHSGTTTDRRSRSRSRRISLRKKLKLPIGKSRNYAINLLTSYLSEETRIMTVMKRFSRIVFYFGEVIFLGLGTKKSFNLAQCQSDQIP